MAKIKSSAPDETRAALARALAERETAQRNLEDAHAAARKANDHYLDAAVEIDKLHDDIARPMAEDFVAQIAGGADVLELRRPIAELRNRLDVLEQHSDAWRHARDVAEQALPIRQQALDDAERRVEHAARAVVAAHIPIDQLLAAAEREAQAILARRAELLTLSRLLPTSDERKAAIEEFLSRPWLLNELAAAERHPAGEPYRVAFEALRHDAAAPMPSGTA